MTSRIILFVFPDFSQYSLHSGYFHYGLASVSAFLKNNLDCEIKLLHIKKKINKNVFLNEISNNQPKIVAFTATTNSFPLVKEYAGWVKSFDEEVLTVLGGVHATIDTENVLLDSGLDVVIRGDGERQILEREGIWYKKNGGLFNGGFSAFEDLDKLPLPDWGLFDYLNLSDPKQGLGGFMASRGCPYLCSYCCNSILKENYRSNGKNYIRFKSPPRMISEIKSFMRTFPALNKFYFDDDILPLYPKWFYEFAGLYKLEINKPYWCNIRPDLINDDIAELLSDSGCVRVGIGIESGNERIRNEVLKRNLSDKIIENAVSVLKKRGIFVYSFNMLGIPFEGKEELLDTVRMNGKLGIDKIQATIFYPYPKTELNELCVKKNLIRGLKWLCEYQGDTILKISLLQKNRIIFTELMVNPLCKLYFKSGRRMREYILKALYSKVSALIILPLVALLLKSILRFKFVSRLIKKIYRKSITKPDSITTT